MASNFESIIFYGEHLHREKRWDEAVKFWKTQFDFNRDASRYLTYLGISLVRTNALDQAADVFKKLRDFFPREPWGYIGPCLISDAHHDWLLSMNGYLEALEKFPDEPSAVQGLAQAYIKLGRIKEAKESLEGTLRREPDFTPAKQILEKLSSVRKIDIVNQLIGFFGLSSYLEYNKPLGEIILNEVECKEKSIAYIPEYKFDAFQKETRTKQAIIASDGYPTEDILDLEQLTNRYEDQRFDLIFFDPMHIRPYVDQTLKALASLLSPDGFLVIHDCNPEDQAIASKELVEGLWCGETYKAYANFHLHNPQQSITIDKDYGVGIILNRNLCLDYSDEFDIDYQEFAKNRAHYNGLISYEAFCSKLSSIDRSSFFISEISK